MKFIVSSTGLFSHLQAISRVINSKNSLPILDCFLMELTDGTLSLTASDSETTLSTSLEVNESDGDGRFAVSSKTILEALKEIPEQPLTFLVNTENLEITVQYQNGKYSLMGQNADEYPQAPALGANAVHVTMGAPVMLAGINRSLFATADDELRPVMNGIYFDITTEDITFVASDGHKLVRNKTFVAHGDEKAAFILPKKPATLLKNLLPKEQGDVQIDFDDRNATFTLENYSMICRLIEGRYPNYNSVIPQDNPHKATIDRMMLISALRRVSVFSSQASSLIKLRLSENQIQISAQDIDFSTSAEETLTCQYTGSPMSIGFKSTFLIDILNNISAQEILFELADPSRAGVIVPVEQEEKEDLLMLLMPMMLKNLLPKEQGDVQIDFDDRNATFTLENYSMICRLIEGRYPNYNSVIPQDNPHKATIDRMMLISALRRVSVFSSQASSLIKLRLSENQIQISAQDIDFSTSAEETLTCQYTGSPMSIGFKSTFLIDILNNISAQEILFELADPSRAGVIVPVEQEEKEDLLMLLMPMMLND